MRQAGTMGPRWLVLAIPLAALTGPSAVVGQEKVQRPTDELGKLETFRSGAAPVVIENNKNDTEQNRQMLDKVARYFVARLNASTTKNEEYRQIRDEVARRLVLPKKGDITPQQNPIQKQYITEFGKAMISHLEGPALNSAKPIVRLNAGIMAAEVGKMGYDGAAELYIKILEKEDMSDGYKEWALKGLHNLFVIVPEPVAPDKTVFQNNNRGQLSPLERHAIKALINYIERKVDWTETTPTEEVDGLRYVRREAVRALGHVRVQTVKNLGNIDSRPAFVLLKVARNDIPSLWPRDPRDQYPTEQLDAIIGFCRLKPDINVRDFNLDYAVYHLGRAIYSIAEFRVAHGTDASISWKAAGSWLKESLETLKSTSQTLKIENAQLVDELINRCDFNILQPIESGIAGNQPNLGPLGKWLQANPPKSTSLFKNDAATAIKVP
jgi:hypothetical protein